MNDPIPIEKSPLLIIQDSSSIVDQILTHAGTDDDHDSNNNNSNSNNHNHNNNNNNNNVRRGQADMTQTVINLAKICAGTGILALPYACQQGGTFVFVVGLMAIAAWNVYGVQRLVACAKYVRVHPPPTHQESGIDYYTKEHSTDLEPYPPVQDELRQQYHQQHQQQQQHQQPPSTASMLGQVAWVAWGPMGLQTMDFMMVILLVGIVISYLSGVISFLSDTPLTLGPLPDALIVATIMALLSMVPDLGYLSNASAFGLVVLAATFVVITGYGLAASSPLNSSAPTPNIINNNMFWPTSWTSLSRFFGICVYGYGVVPLTFNIRDSMKEPNRVVEATAIALSIVAIGYCTLGVALWTLFPHVTGQILHELPAVGILPTLTRVAMALVCVVTAPLIIVPTGEMLEAKLSLATHAYHRYYKWMVRCSVCLVGAIVAVLLPTFVQVLSFVGCCCVGLVGFCVPPFLHLRLMQLRGVLTIHATAVWVDVIMLLLGSVATAIGTILSVR